MMLTDWNHVSYFYEKAVVSLSALGQIAVYQIRWQTIQWQTHLVNSLPRGALKLIGSPHIADDSARAKHHLSFRPPPIFPLCPS